MRIGVEASAIFRARKTGVGYYSHGLVAALMEEMPEDVFLLCYIGFITKPPAELDPSPPNARYRRISLFPGKVYGALDHYLVPPPFDLLARAKADVFLFPNFFRWPLWWCRRSVIVIHDLAFLDTPQFLVPRHQRYMNRRIPQSVRKATHVVAVSEHTKQQLIRHYGVAPDKITVVNPGVDLAKYRPATDDDVRAVKKKYGISGKYLLFLGTTDPRKNITGIVKAYGLLPQAVRANHQLVLAGAPGRDWGWGWLDDEIDGLVKALPAGSVVRTGYLADNDKIPLLAGAELFIWPSHYEGWGMPILEAMACGTPVITARNSSLPEAGGEAAAYVETADPVELCGLIRRLLDDPGRLAAMRKEGVVHAGRFTWKVSAGKLAAVLRDLPKD